MQRRQQAGELGRVKAVYVTTYYDNPCAVTLPAARRAALVEIAKRWSRRQKIYLIEDAAYRELRYRGDDMPSLRAFDPDGDTVVHAGTFSKSFSPGIRVGWGVLPPKLAKPVLAEKGNFDFGSPNFNQVLMTAVLEQGLFDEQVERLRGLSREDRSDPCRGRRVSGPDRRHSMAAPSGGLYVWLCLPEGIDTGMAGPLFDRAVAEGVLYVPGEYCYPAEGQPRPKNTLRLSFGSQPVGQLRRGVEALARAIRGVL